MIPASNHSLTLFGVLRQQHSFVFSSPYETKNGALSAAAPKVFFRYFLVNSSTGERSVSMLAEAKYTVVNGG